MAKILLIGTGSIAAIKMPDIIKSFKEKGHEVTCVLSWAAEHFVTPMSLSFLSGNKVYTEMFNPDDESKMSHIALSRDNDLIIIAPASADFMAKMANGLCDDLASTICLATDKPVIVAPAMNHRMYQHPATQRNLKTLKSDGITIIDPEEGELACGEEGTGRLANVETIVATAENFLSGKKKDKKFDLTGVKCLVTSGPTRENIDPVRYISNYSSGKQGYAIAEALRNLGADVYLVSGPTELKKPRGVNFIAVQSAEEMLSTCQKLLPVDVAICAAAVADWRPEHKQKQKIKKKQDDSNQMLMLIANQDILFEISKPGAKRPKLVIGFAAETEHLVENAMVKLERKQCDWIIANNVAENDIFGSDNNSVKIINKKGIYKEVTATKKDVAIELSEIIATEIKK